MGWAIANHVLAIEQFRAAYEASGELSNALNNIR